MSECLIERGLYACSDGVKCISADLLCNNHTDCLGAGDDERPMCSSILTTKNQFGQGLLVQFIFRYK